MAGDRHLIVNCFENHPSARAATGTVLVAGDPPVNNQPGAATGTAATGTVLVAGHPPQHAIVFLLIINLIGASYWAVYIFMPWLISNVEEMSPKQLETTKRHLAGNGIALSTDRNEYAPGDIVLLTITNHTKIELEHQPGWFHFRIDVLRARTDSEAFSISPGDSKTVSLGIPETADPGQYSVLAGATRVRMQCSAENPRQGVFQEGCRRLYDLLMWWTYTTYLLPAFTGVFEPSPRLLPMAGSSL